MFIKAPHRTCNDVASRVRACVHALQVHRLLLRTTHAETALLVVVVLRAVGVDVRPGGEEVAAADSPCQVNKPVVLPFVSPRVLNNPVVAAGGSVGAKPDNSDGMVNGFAGESRAACFVDVVGGFVNMRKDPGVDTGLNRPCMHAYVQDDVIPIGAHVSIKLRRQ